MTDAVLVLRDKYARGWPLRKADTPFCDRDRGASVSLSAAFAAQYPTDAHFSAYASEHGVRFNSDVLQPSVVSTLPNGGVAMVAFVVDIDAPNHAPTEPWRTTERDKLGRVWAAVPGFHYFETRGGYRLVWRLSELVWIRSYHDADVWTARYKAWLAGLKTLSGIEGDDACTDWTRLYRLPFVVRDGQPQGYPAGGDLTAGVWPIGETPVLPARTTPAGLAAEFPDDLSDKLDHGAIATLLAPYYPKGVRNGMARAVGAYLCNRGYSPLDASTVVYTMAELAGSDNPEGRADDAANVFRDRTPKGWSALVEFGVPANVLEQLERAVPDLREGARRAAAEALKASLLLAPTSPRAATVDAVIAQAVADHRPLLSALAPNDIAPTPAPAGHVETIGREEFHKIASSLASKKRTDAEQQRGRALKKALAGAPLADTPEASALIALALASDIARSYPNAGVDYSVLAVALERSGVQLPAFHARVLEEQSTSRAIREKRELVHERRRGAGLLLDESGNPKNCIANIAQILETDPAWDGVLGYDLLAHRTKCLKPPPIDIDTTNCFDSDSWLNAYTTAVRIWINQNYDFEPYKDGANDAIEHIARKRSFHPVREYLQSLRWDGVPRIDRFFVDYLGTPDDAWHKCVGAKFLISAVARACPRHDKEGRLEAQKVDTVIVLEGTQGAFKSTAFRRLIGTKWFSDSPLPVGKPDAVQQLDGVWGQEFADMTGISKTELETLKGFLSSIQDNIRRSYAARAEREPRQCVFVASTNDHEYLKDPTGARRFWPVRCALRGLIDLMAIERDRDQLWAEAYYRYWTNPANSELQNPNGPGERWWLAGSEHLLAAAEQEARYEVHPWEEKIQSFLTKNPHNVTNGVTTNEILDFIFDGKAERQTQSEATKVGQILRRLGWATGPRVTGPDGSRQRRYFPRAA